MIKPYDWDQAGLQSLAEAFCERIRAAAPKAELGVTSHYRAASTFPKLPWGTFFRYATTLLPQAYWRSSDGVIGHGLPADNYQRSIDFWTAAGADSAKIVPMAGELGSVTAGEVKEHAVAAAAAGIRKLHFYCHEPGVKTAVWQALAALD